MDIHIVAATAIATGTAIHVATATARATAGLAGLAVGGLQSGGLGVAASRPGDTLG